MKKQAHWFEYELRIHDERYTTMVNPIVRTIRQRFNPSPDRTHLTAHEIDTIPHKLFDKAKKINKHLAWVHITIYAIDTTTGIKVEHKVYEGTFNQIGRFIGK